MWIKKICSLILLSLLGLPALFITLSGGWGNGLSLEPADFWDGSAAKILESTLEEAFPYEDSWRNAAASLQTALGRNQQNGYFYSEQGILQNLPSPDENITAQNLLALQNLAQSKTIPSYFALLPTAAAVQQSKVPSLALDTLFNQKDYIQHCYNDFAPYGRTIDVYSTLFSHQQESLYYHSDSRLTGLGNYYFYLSAGKKLGYSARPTNYFDISYAGHGFTGNLSKYVPYSNTSADVLSLFHYKKHNRSFTVVRDPTGNPIRSDDLYDLSMLDSIDPLQVYLGQDTGVTDILVNDTPYEGTLLVLTDGSCTAAFPLMAIHYQKIRIVNLYSATAKQIQQSCGEEFDQLLFSFSVENFGYDHTIANSLAVKEK